MLVEVTRSGNVWAIEIPAVRGAHTQAKRLDDVERMARDCVAGLLDISPESFVLEMHAQLG